MTDTLALRELIASWKQNALQLRETNSKDPLERKRCSAQAATLNMCANDLARVIQS
jgi:hypothetical protein